MPNNFLVDPLVRSQIHYHLRVVPHHLYVLGRLGLRVNVYSQQVRAINLAHILAEELPRDSRIAVVGGGVAGLTTAAAAAWLGFRNVTLYEAELELMGVFRHNTVRYLHPHMYDWPDPGWKRDYADVPILDWSAGTPSKVAQSIGKDWDRFRHVFPIEFYTESEVLRIFRHSRRGRPTLTLSFEHSARREFDAVVLALGFGDERNLQPGDHPGYWSNDTVEVTKGDRGKRYLISGCGDGGLIDYLRARLRGFDQANLIAELLPDGDPEIEDAKRALSRIEEELGQRAPDGKPDLTTQLWHLQSYWEIKAEGIQARIRKRLRPTQVQLTSTHRTPLEPGAFIVNRFLALQVLRIDRLKLDRIGWPLANSTAPFLPNLPLSLTGKDDYKVIPRHGPDSALRRFVQIEREFKRRSGGLFRVRDVTGQPAWRQGERQNEGYRRWALIKALLGIEAGRNREYLLDLLETLLRFCSDHSEAAKSILTLPDSNRDFVASRSNLAEVFADLGDSPNQLELQRLLAALSDHWEQFGYAYLTARLAVASFQDALSDRLWLRFGRLIRQGPRDVLRGTVVPIPARLFPTRSGDDEVEGTVPKLTRFAWLPEQPDYEVRYVWENRLPEVNSPCEIGILLPNPDRLQINFSRNSIGWTAQLAQPDEQLRQVLALLARGDRRQVPIKALVMPEFSASPEIVARLRERLVSWGGTSSLIVAAGSYHSIPGADEGIEHESALLVVGRREVRLHLMRKSSRCHFHGNGTEGIQERPPRITVLMSRSSAVVCLICADFNLAGVAAVLPLLRPSLVLVPACNGEPLRDRAFELASSSGAIVAIAQSRSPSTRDASKTAAIVIGPPRDEESAPIQWSSWYPLPKPKLVRPPTRRSGRGAPGRSGKNG